MNRDPGTLAAALITRAETNADLASKAGYWRRWGRHLDEMSRACERSGDEAGAVMFRSAAVEFAAYTKVREWAADPQEATPFDVGLLDGQEHQA